MLGIFIIWRRFKRVYN